MSFCNILRQEGECNVRILHTKPPIQNQVEVWTVFSQHFYTDLNGGAKQ